MQEAEEERRRHEEWAAKRLREHAEWNAMARRHGWRERPAPYVGPDWLERLQARAASRLG